MMSEREFIYLDNAATTWPKPASVTDAITDYYRNVGAAAGRGSSSRSAKVDRTIEQCRVALAKLINVNSGSIVFCFNGTDGLNTAISGMIRNGDHVVASDIEHNSVLRPIHELASQGRISFDLVKSNNGAISAESVANSIVDSTRLFCVSHVSNVTGIEQDIVAIVAACRKANPDSFVIVDAAQSVGHISVDASEIDCDILVSSGHKGLMGPLGTGFVWLSDRASEEITPVRFGGTGSGSESIEQPLVLPDRLESGSPNVGGIFGLLQGVQFIAERGLEEIAKQELRLANRLIESLRIMEGVQLYGVENPNRTGVISFNIENQDPQTVGTLLDVEFGIQLRAGYHCAPLMHQALGTDKIGGTLRASPSVFNTERDIDKLVAGVNQLVAQLD